jgi:hypothetical protein
MEFLDDKLVETIEVKTDLVDLIEKLKRLNEEILQLQSERNKIKLILTEASKTELSKDVLVSVTDAIKKG